MLQASVGKTDKYIFGFFATRHSWLILTKTRNDLKRHKTTYKRARNNLKRLETTWNDLQHWNDLQRPEKTYNKQETTWNDLQQLRNNQQRPENTCNEQKKDAKRPTTSRFPDYFTIWGNRFSSLTCFYPNIWLQSFEHCFTENHGENRAPNISILSCVFITGYKIYGILTLRTTLTLVN